MCVVCTYCVIFLEVLVDGAQRVPLKPETQTQDIHLTQIFSELLRRGPFSGSMDNENSADTYAAVYTSA